jgi:DNA-binding response OmpR family regulator
VKKRVLVVEDDLSLGRILRDNLAFDGFEVEWITDGGAAVGSMREFAPDLVLLDVSLPGTDGFELCGVLRQEGRTPIIFLTARTQKTDKMTGFALGADDYVTKPFDLEELLARVHAVLRRARAGAPSTVLGSVTVDFQALEAYRDEAPLHLTHREFQILQYLLERAGRVVLRTELLRAIWGYLDVPNTRSVDHAIARLRKKIEGDAHHPQFIHTVHGDGYCLTPEGRARPR